MSPPLQGHHDVECAGHEIRSADPPQMVDAPPEERLDFFNNLGRQASCFGAQYPGQTHPSIPLDFAAEHRISVARSRKLKIWQPTSRVCRSSVILTADSP